MAANATVDGCMVALTLRAATSGYPTVALAHVSRLDDADPDAKADAALQALSEWLTDNEAADADIHTTVEKVRAERPEEIVLSPDRWRPSPKNSDTPRESSPNASPEPSTTSPRHWTN
ncbi:hypothetical protein OG819_45910 [Streptomyces sp. NBC_01549]|uniref:hypothetical protein n=1 Tax=Streptomyces sp. NBC_01549 TaxID=2975874 RepID=UPI00225A5F42|nr:hypothetical protein [Streptomyces sp. NBC_01549]MCX4596727.1 hypothetical protein [Streptomyces sp. NBC_01549]